MQLERAKGLVGVLYSFSAIIRTNRWRLSRAEKRNVWASCRQARVKDIKRTVTGLNPSICSTHNCLWELFWQITPVNPRFLLPLTLLYSLFSCLHFLPHKFPSLLNSFLLSALSNSNAATSAWNQKGEKHPEGSHSCFRLDVSWRVQPWILLFHGRESMTTELWKKKM